MYYKTYDVHFIYDIVCWHTTSYVENCTYDIAYDIDIRCTLYTYDVACLVWRTMSYTICIHDVVRLTYDVVRVRTMWTERTTSYVWCRRSIIWISYVRCRTCDVTYDVVRPTYDVVLADVRHRTWRTTSRWQESRWQDCSLLVWISFWILSITWLPTASSGP